MPNGDERGEREFRVICRSVKQYFKPKVSVPDKAMNRALKITLKIISNTLLTLVILLAILLAGVKIVGIDMLTVLSPSMEPDYPTGSLIYLVEVDPSELQVEDVITYRIAKDTTATHRIKEIVPDEFDPSISRFRTKGDNNEDFDGKLVDFDQVEGQVVFCIPQLGRLATYIQSPPGIYVAIAVTLAIIFFVMTVDMVTDDKKQKHKNKNENKGEPENEKD